MNRAAILPEARSKTLPGRIRGRRFRGREGEVLSTGDAAPRAAATRIPSREARPSVLSSGGTCISCGFHPKDACRAADQVESLLPPRGQTRRVRYNAVATDAARHLG